MLMRCSMVNDIRTICFKHLLNPACIAHGTDQSVQIQSIAVFTFELLLNRIGVILIDIKDDKHLRLMCCDLTAKFAADRAATACN